MTTCLTLFIPALTGRAGDEARPAPPSRLPALETLLARAQRRHGVSGGMTASLFHLFGVNPSFAIHHALPPDGRYPVAALTGLCDDLHNPTDGLWLRADPVHLAADRDRVVMTAYEHLAVRPAEVRQLVDEFNGLFGEDGLALHAPTPQRWYLRVPQPPSFSASAVDDVVGQDIDPHLPRGEAAMGWHRLLNEVQMLFHASDVNQARQQRGELPVNSLWFWGGGVLPDAPPASWSAVWSNEIVSRALARYCRVAHQSLPPTAGEWLEHAGGGEHLVVMDGARNALRNGDIAAWHNFLEGVENEWIAPLTAAVTSAGVGEVRLQTGDGGIYCATSKTLRRWWVRRRPLACFQPMS